MTCESTKDTAIEILSERAERYERALRFYADPAGTKDEFGDPVVVPDFYDELDFGARARRALYGK